MMGWLDGVDALVQHPRIDVHLGGSNSSCSGDGDVSQSDAEDTPLYIAAARGHTAVVRRLLRVPQIDRERGMIVNCKSYRYMDESSISETSSRHSPKAAAAKYPEVVSLLDEPAPPPPP